MTDRRGLPAPTALSGARWNTCGTIDATRWWLTILGTWAAGRLIVLISILLSPRLATFVPKAVPLGMDLRWRAWDALWYERMLTLGWDGVSPEGYRFFPGYPLTAEPLAILFGSLVALFMVNWLTALGGIALAGELTKRTTNDDALARRVIVLTGIFPAAMALVLPYSEGLALLLIAAALISLLGHRWRWVTALCSPKI